MQEGNGITNGDDPGHNTSQGHNLVALAHDTDVVGEITALNISQDYIVVPALIKCCLESWQAWMVQVAEDARFML